MKRFPRFGLGLSALLFSLSLLACGSMATRGVRSSTERGQRRAAIWNDGVAQLAAICERGIESGTFEPGPPDRLARTMLAMQQVQLADWLEDGMTAGRESVMRDVEALIRRTFCTPEWRDRPASP